MFCRGRLEAKGMEKNSKQAADAALESVELQKLKKSYDCLRSDYTRKCQELSKLRRAADNSAETVSPSAEPQAAEEASSRGDEEIIKDYILKLESGQPPVLISGGGNLQVSQPKKPKTLKEAGELAIRYIGRK